MAKPKATASKAMVASRLIACRAFSGATTAGGAISMPVLWFDIALYLREKYVQVRDTRRQRLIGILMARRHIGALYRINVAQNVFSYPARFNRAARDSENRDSIAATVAGSLTPIVASGAVRAAGAPLCLGAGGTAGAVGARIGKPPIAFGSGNA
jgi:hypothetical protein